MSEKLTNVKIYTKEEILLLLKENDTNNLCKIANELRQKYQSNFFDTCSIVNAKSGNCSEDCAWCSQSCANKAIIEKYPLLNYDKILLQANANESLGIKRYSIVCSGKTQSGQTFENIVKYVENLKKDTRLSICASLGLLNEEQLLRLKQAGLSRYHCNLESSRNFLLSLCSTHSYDDKIKTIKFAQKCGIMVCSGGIIGMGESMEDRIDLAIDLRNLNIKSIPLNILNPIKFTRLENQSPLSLDEIIRTFCVFKIINPLADIRLAGGRNTLGKNNWQKLLDAGVSAGILQNMLTTKSVEAKEDFEVFKQKNYQF